MKVCTVSDVRRAVGIGTDSIENDDVSRLITEAVDSIESYLNTAIKPKEVIESIDPNTGTDSSEIILNHEPILNILDIKIDGDSVSPKYVKYYPGGIIQLTSDAETTSWDDDPQANVIEYSYGYVEDSKPRTTTTSAVTPSTSASLSVSDESGIEADDWVRVYGMDGYSEVSQVSSIASQTLTLDIYYPHESGSYVVLQQVPHKIKRLVEVIASLMMVARIVGQSYTDIVGYGLEGFNVQKGEPYTQWQETFRQMDKERKSLLKHVRRMPAIG